MTPGQETVWWAICSPDEATANSIAPVSFTHPAYEYMDDGDSDGVVCD